MKKLIFLLATPEPARGSSMNSMSAREEFVNFDTKSVAGRSALILEFK
ncbi:MAG: hypothetical protein K6E35_01615 [Bacteroidales bacterium]|nr:hypothetical protein [Bacteroidales bacterium]